ncbi:MAG: Lrp/AsnC family transcriptional regulator [Desulfoprunum sp.]|nr:Lrp/AsnC family transcriptional regulator [Desulfoprunum sp.]
MQKPHNTPLDEIDQSILSALQQNGKLTNVQLAQKVGLSESACLRRVRLLEASGVVDRYAMIVNQTAIGLPGNVFIRVTLEGQVQEKLSLFEEAIKRIPEVMECYLMSGEVDYVLRVICKDNTDFTRTHSRLASLPGVLRINSSFTLRTVIKKTELPIHISR